MINSHRKVLSDYTGKTLIFHQPSIVKKNYQLLFQDEIIGSLEITGTLKINSKVRIFDKEWEIRKESFWKNDYGIYQLGYELSMAVYSGKVFGSGVLKLEKGIILRFVHNIWKGISEVKTESGKILISAKDKSFWKTDREVSILEKNEIIDSKPWILMLLMFIDKTRQKHSAVVT